MPHSLFRLFVVPYIGTWIETEPFQEDIDKKWVVPYIGTWIETDGKALDTVFGYVVPYIGTWIETTTIFQPQTFK